MPTADSSRPRVLVAATLRVVGVALVVVALLLAYANRVIYKPAEFAERSALSLRDPRVAGFVAERIADQAIARRPNLVAVRPVMVAAARAVVASDAFRVLFRSASQRAHEIAFSKGTETVVLSLPDFAVLLNGAMSRLDPKLVGRLPSPLGAQLGKDVEQALGAGTLRLLHATRRLRRFALVTLVLGLASLVASVFVLRNRRQGLLLAGLAVAAAGDRAVRGAVARRTARLGPHRRAVAPARGARGVGRVHAAPRGLGARARCDGPRPRRGRVLLREPRRGRAGHPPRVGVAAPAVPEPAVRGGPRGGPRGRRPPHDPPARRDAALPGRPDRRRARLRGDSQPVRPHRAAHRRGGRSRSGRGRRGPAGAARPGAPRALRRHRSPRGRGDRVWHRVAQQPRRDPVRGRGVQGPVQRLRRPLRPPARPGRSRRRAQRDVRGRLPRLDVPEPGGRDGRADATRHPRAPVRRAQRDPGGRAREDRARGRARLAREVRDGPRTGGCRRGDAHPRPPRRPAGGAEGPLPVPRVLRAGRAAARRRAA